MAVLRQGSVITATVEQSLGNCLLVHFKHRSRTFRGVLFDEKNSIVPRASISRQSDDQKLMSNKSSLPLGMAVVSPSKQPYSSLRNRIYYNTTSKRPGGSNSRGSVSRNSEIRSTFLSHAGSTGKDSSNDREGSSQTHRKPGLTDVSESDTRHSSRLLRQRGKNSTSNGNGVKRKAETELAGSKPSKTRSNVKSESTSDVSWNSSKNDSKAHKKPAASKSSQGKVTLVGSDSNNKVINTENEDKILACDEQSETAGNNENNRNITPSLTSVRPKLFPPEHDLKTSNIFNNESSTIEVMQSEECTLDSSDGAAEFFGSLGLGSACQDGDDGSVFTDSSASCSSNEQLGEKPDLTEEEKDNLKNESELQVSGGLLDEEYEGTKAEELCGKQPLTPTKKSARISAKRAILEQNMASYDDDDGTIWSIWGGVPSKKQKDRPPSSSDSNLPVESPESLPEILDVSHTSSTTENISLNSTARAKGARIKQTPVRAKKVASVCIPEKQVSVGNIVWGKVHGHPWWPGRVLAVSGNFGEGEETTKHAHVTWFGSNTSSIMPVHELQHFVANFARRHKKTKRGCYRKAVKQAQDMVQIMGEEF